MTLYCAGYTPSDGDEEDGSADEDEVGNRDKRTKKLEAAAKGSSAKVQYMITNRMRNKLIKELGYLSEEVDMIEPQIAAVVIERALSRPSSGMPSSWRKTTVAKRPKKRGQGIGSNIFSKLIGSLGSLFQSATFLLPAVAAIALLIRSGSVDDLKNFNMKSIIPARQQSKPSSTNTRKPSAYLQYQFQRGERQDKPQPKLQTKQPPNPKEQPKLPKKTSSQLSIPASTRSSSTTNRSFNYQNQINVNALEQLQRKNF